MNDSAKPISQYIQNMPKAELHLHIEGTFEPHLMLQIAERNKIKTPYNSIEEVYQAYHFKNLADFLTLYYQNTDVLRNEQDFYDLTWAYLKKAKQENICHAEIFFDPQAHTERGIPFGTVVSGIHRALADGQKNLNITSGLIMCFLRDLPIESALKTFRESLNYRDKIIGIGLDSNEMGYPPANFKQIFEMAGAENFFLVAHAGETAPAEYIWQALDTLKVLRVDHGIKCMDDIKLMERLVSQEIPLTVCPLSNVKLKVVGSMQEHPLKKMLDYGIHATIHSDDPAYFGGYLNENIHATHAVLGLTLENIYQLQKNAFKASFITPALKQSYLKKLEHFHQQW